MTVVDPPAAAAEQDVPGDPPDARAARRAVSPAAYAAFLDALSTDLLRRTRPLDGPGAVTATREFAAGLGIAPGRLAEELHQALAQHGTLGPDESAEYRRNLGSLLADTAADPARPTPQELFTAFHRVGLEVVGTMAEVLPPRPDRTVVFLGSDAEFLKLGYDLLAGRPDASAAFYLSRLSLLSEAERAVLPATGRAVFGEAGVSAQSSAGRHHAWMDNGLLATQTAQLVARAREQARRDGEHTFEELFLASFAEEVTRGTGQAQRLREGRLTGFGTAHPAVDAVIRAGIADGLYAERCRALGRELLAAFAPGQRLTLVDIGANGTQPCLLFGALELLRPGARQASVHLFTPYPDRWGRPGDRFVTAPVTGRFALGVETVKSFATDYQGAAAGQDGTLVAVPRSQRVLAYLKQLAFHRAALELRAASR